MLRRREGESSRKRRLVLPRGPAAASGASVPLLKLSDKKWMVIVMDMTNIMDRMMMMIVTTAICKYDDNDAAGDNDGSDDNNNISYRNYNA